MKKVFFFFFFPLEERISQTGFQTVYGSLKINLPSYVVDITFG